jgi:tRNA-modifying protein YgfZ
VKIALTWMHALTTQHLEKLPAGEWKEALILDAQGHVEEQIFLVDDGSILWLHTEKERAAGLINYLEKMKFMLRVEVKDVSDEYAVLRAPGVADSVGGPYALVPRTELADTIEAFKQSHTEVGMWALRQSELRQDVQDYYLKQIINRFRMSLAF